MIESTRIKYQEEFIKKASEIHNNYYDYSKVYYINSYTNVEILCPKHDSFFKRPDYHLKGSICNTCRKESMSLKDTFIDLANKIHDNKFDYSKMNYINNRTKIEIICPIHKSIFQTPQNHLNYGCSKCYGNFKIDMDTFLKRSNNIHNNYYNYDKVVIKNTRSDIIINCPIHGDFEQNMRHHMNGHGCYLCGLNKSNGEKQIEDILIFYNIKYTKQKRFDDCKHIRKLIFDFYLPEYNFCIEYDGIQHFKPIGFFGGQKAFEETIIKDNIKTEYCRNNNIELIRIKYDDNILNQLKSIYKNKKYMKTFDEKYIGDIVTKAKYYIVENNKSDNPYHNTEHMINVYNNCMNLFELYSGVGNLNEYDKLYLGLAALFHDFNHSGGKLTDTENIELALNGLKDYLTLIKRMDCYDDVENIIISTEFPHKDIELNLLQKIIRDADTMGGIVDGWENVVKNLAKEYNKPLSEFIPTQIKFLNSAKFYTPQCNDLLKIKKEEIIEVCN